MLLLVHSLWEKLWIEIFFPAYKPLTCGNIRILLWKKEISRPAIIHSPTAPLGIPAGSSRAGAVLWLLNSSIVIQLTGICAGPSLHAFPVSEPVP
jgi:hypothetical protein